MPRSFSVALALAAVYIFWGSTAPAIRIGVATLSPWWLAAIRFGIAGSALWLWCRLRHVPLPAVAEWRTAAFTGVVLLVLGNAVFAWTLQYLPSGIGSLVFALSPLWMVSFAFLMHGERLSPVAAAGIALGLAGMLFLYSPSGEQHLAAVPTAVALATSLAWGFGSIVQRRLRGSDVLQISAMQMLVAAAVLVVVARVTGAPLSAASFSPATVAALVYLILFGSIAGFSAYLWLMNAVPTALASTYSYVNPVVSLAIGIGLLHEPFSWRLAAGAGVMLAGVAIMMLAPHAPRSANKLPPGTRQLHL